MGLLNNGYRHNLTGKIVGSSNVDGWRPQVGLYQGHRTAAMRNLFAGQGITDDMAAAPEGMRPPVAWIMARKSGAVASRNEATITFGASGSGSMGVAAEGTASVVLSLAGTGGLITSASGVATISLDAAASLFASKAAYGEATVSINGSAIVLALAHAEGSAGVALSAEWTPTAIGWLEGTTADAGLTPNGIAQAVWTTIIEAGFSAEQILRILAAHAAGSATGLEGVDPQFTGLDGVTVRIDGTYNAGTRTIDALNGG